MAPRFQDASVKITSKDEQRVQKQAKRLLSRCDQGLKVRLFRTEKCTHRRRTKLRSHSAAWWSHLWACPQTSQTVQRRLRLKTVHTLFEPRPAFDATSPWAEYFDDRELNSSNREFLPSRHCRSRFTNLTISVLQQCRILM